MILAGDIGGTSTRLAFFEESAGTLRAKVEQIYSSQAHASLDEILARFIADYPLPAQAAAFGIAGPVRAQRVETPNLAWIVDGRSLAQRLGLRCVELINDLEANAWGIGALQASDFVTLNAGIAGAKGNQAVISAGTGLGEAGLYWDGRTHHPFACEGGHSDFAPRNNEEVALLNYLRGRFDRVSYERVVSGPGLHNIFAFLRDDSTGAGAVTPALQAALEAGDPAAAISAAALDGSDPVAMKALAMFVSLYGAEAGNLALKTMATGGVFIGGGIAPRILEQLQGPSFLQAFVAKGRMRPLLEAMPVKVILNEKTALLGAARFAAQRSRD